MKQPNDADRDSCASHCSTANDVVERIMTAHWDMAACRCWVCSLGRSIGLRPREKWLKNENRNKRPVPTDGWGKQ